MILFEQFTEDQVQDIFDDVYSEFYEHKDELGFDDFCVSKIVKYLNKNNRKTLGLCSERNGRFVISLNPHILNFEEDGEKIIRETFAHELCHTLPGCMNHGKNFHAKASLIKKLLGYNINTKADIDSSEYFLKYLSQSNYILKCDTCGNVTPISKLSDPVRNPSSYVCTKCNGRVSSYVLDKNTGEYELYKSSKDEPEYKYVAKCENCSYTYPFGNRSQMFKKILHTIVNGGTVKCPRCRNLLYLVDNGKEIHSNS